MTHWMHWFQIVISDWVVLNIFWHFSKFRVGGERNIFHKVTWMRYVTCDRCTHLFPSVHCFMLISGAEWERGAPHLSHRRIRSGESAGLPWSRHTRGAWARSCKKWQWWKQEISDDTTQCAGFLHPFQHRTADVCSKSTKQHCSQIWKEMKHLDLMDYFWALNQTYHWIHFI